MYRLIALDLDDTLLDRRDGLIHPADRAALDAARAAGCEITLVTARSWRATAAFVEDLGVATPVICMTGAMTYAPDGRILDRQVIPLEQARRLAAWAEDEQWSFRFYFAEGLVVHSRRAEDYVPKTGAHFQPVPFVGDLAPYLADGDEPIQGVALGHSSVEKALARLPELPGLVATTYERNTHTSRTHLMHEAVSKGAALERLCRERGIPREAVIAMGDSETDRSMIRWAGTGVAMGWAPEPVRAAADLVADEADPHPVATMLGKLLGV